MSGSILPKQKARCTSNLRSAEHSNSTQLVGRCVVPLFGDKVAALRVKRMSKLFTRRFLDPGRKRRLTVHQCVKIQGVQNQHPGRRHCRGWAPTRLLSCGAASWTDLNATSVSARSWIEACRA